MKRSALPIQMNDYSQSNTVANNRSKKSRGLLYSEKQGLALGEKWQRVVSIDESSSRCGFAVVEKERRLIFAQSLSFSDKLSHKERRKQIVSFLQELIKTYMPDAIIVERIREHTSKKDGSGETYRGKDTVIVFNRIIGSIVDAVDLHVYSVHTASWRSRMIGSKSADKEASVMAAKWEFGIDVDHDTAEAIYIGLSSFCKDIRLWPEQ